jgi:hypothetical protein
LLLVVILLAKGRAPQVVQPWLCGASLVAVPKPKGGLRPVAVGETWRRLVSKVLASSVAEEVRDDLEPVQVGAGVRGGCEAVVHATRQWLHRNREDCNKVLVKLDLTNAFNSIDRSACLHSIRRVAPALALWADFCYTREGHLLLDGRRWVSARGIQQGDPLGPALFAVALHDAIVSAKADTETRYPGKLHFVVFYLDDGVVAGDALAVSHFKHLFQQRVSDLGLCAADSECEVIHSAGSSWSFSEALFAGCVWKIEEGFKLLGSPFGSNAFVLAHASSRVAKTDTLMSKK